jgi:ectoine hydroxylase
VLWGGAAGPWDQAALEAYEREGYRFQPGLFSPQETAELLAEAERLAAEASPRDRGVVAEPGNDIIRSVFRLHRLSDTFRSVCQDQRLAGAARQLLGSEVYVHQSRINYKPAFDGKEFFWHSDFETWHVEDGMPRMRAVSVSLSLTESNEFNGPLMVVPGSHRTYIRCQGQTPEDHYQQSLRKQEYGVPSREAMQLLIDQGGLTAPKGPGGSGLFFECNLMHGSAGNMSPYPRINFFVVFNSLENTMAEPFGDRPPRPDYLAERDPVPVAAL